MSKMLFINACSARQGDNSFALSVLQRIPQNRCSVTAASIPEGAVVEDLRKMPETRVVPVTLGGLEGYEEGTPPTIWRQTRDFGKGFVALMSIVRQEKFSVICSIDRTVSAHHAALLSRLTGVPLLFIAAYPYYPQGGFRNRATLRRAHRIISHSQFLTDRLAPHTRHAGAEIVTIHIGIETADYTPLEDSATARAELGVPIDAPLVVLPGRVNQFKGQDDLIHAAKQILEVRSDARFVMVGSEDPDVILRDGVLATFKQHCQNLIDSLGLRDRVWFAGYVPDLKSVIGAADIVTMPSHEEPFGLVALEGMAMRRPVVSTRAGGVPEFLIDGECGLLVPPRDPAALAKGLLSLIDSLERAREMGARGRERVTQFHSMEVYMRSFLPVLDEVLANR